MNYSYPTLIGPSRLLVLQLTKNLLRGESEILMHASHTVTCTSFRFFFFVNGGLDSFNELTHLCFRNPLNWC